MDAIPPLLSSAQALLNDGFSRQNNAATQIVNSSLFDPATPPDPPSSPNSTNPFLGGILDLTNARTEISAGTLLLNTYNRTMNDLFHSLDPNHQYSQKTYGSFSTYG